MREQFWLSERLPRENAVAEAIREEEGLIILSDTGDSVYGGAPGDSTHILEALLAADLNEIALVPMLDPEAQAAAAAAGIGAEVTLSVGGKLDNTFSAPVEVSGKVAGLSKGLEVWVELRGYSDMGPTALIEAGNVRIVLQARWTRRMIRVDSPGMTQSNLKDFKWRFLPRPIHPLDDLPEWSPR